MQQNAKAAQERQLFFLNYRTGTPARRQLTVKAKLSVVRKRCFKRMTGLENRVDVSETVDHHRPVVQGSTEVIEAKDT